MSQLKVKELLLGANYLLDKCFPIFPGYAVIKRGRMERLLDKLDASIPEDIKEAERILLRREQIIQDAQSKAERIILDATAEANHILSESELLRAVQAEALRIKEQVIAECDDVKKHTLEETEQIKAIALQEAQKIREGAEDYAEKMLINLEQNLDQLQTQVRNGQEYFEQMRADAQWGRSSTLGMNKAGSYTNEIENSRTSQSTEKEVQFALD